MTCARRSAFQSPVARRPFDLADDQLDEAVEQVVLVPDVPVEGHRVDPELLAELAHAQRVEPVAVGQLHRDPKHAISAGAALGARPLSAPVVVTTWSSTPRLWSCLDESTA